MRINAIDISIDSSIKKNIINNLSLSILSGEIVGIVGRSGAGKTVLIKMLSYLVKLDRGTIVYSWDKKTNNNVISNNNDRIVINSNTKVDVSKIRNSVTVCFQHSEIQIFNKDVKSELIFALKYRGASELTAMKMVNTVINKYIRLDKTFLSRFPLTLSSGEKRRIALMSSIILEPEILFLDEIEVGVDVSGREEIISLIRSYKNNNKGVVLISHNLTFLMRFCTRIIVLDKGKILLDSASSVFFNSLPDPEINKIIDFPFIARARLILLKKAHRLSSELYNKINNIDEINKLISVVAFMLTGSWGNETKNI